MSRRETILKTIMTRIASVHRGTLRRAARDDDDAAIDIDDLPAVVIEMRRDAAESANEVTKRTLEFDLSIYTAGDTRAADADALIEDLIPAILAQAADLQKAVVREGDTTWTQEQSGSSTPILRTSIAITIKYRTTTNSID